LAFGDTNGGLKVIGLTADGEYKVQFEKDNFLGGQINEIVWLDDNKKLVCVGAGNNRAVGIDTSSGMKIGGELGGSNGTILSADAKITRPFKFVSTGEDKEIQAFKGPPFNHLKAIQNAATNFLTRIAFTPWDDGAHYIAVATDKSIKVYNTESNELVAEKLDAHSMGIQDFCYTSAPGEILTSSNDRTVKSWKVDLEAKTISETFVFNLSDRDSETLTQNHEKQQLAVAFANDQVFAVNFNAEINYWLKDSPTP